MSDFRRDYSPFFDQEPPQRPVTGIIAHVDTSESYELEATGVFTCEAGFLVVNVSGCSCWPDRGGTIQELCEDRIAVQRCLTGFCSYASAVLAECEQSKWGDK